MIYNKKFMNSVFGMTTGYDYDGDIINIVSLLKHNFMKFLVKTNRLTTSEAYSRNITSIIEEYRFLYEMFLFKNDFDYYVQLVKNDEIKFKKILKTKKFKKKLLETSI